MSPIAAATFSKVTVALAAGLHPIAVAMFEQSGGFELAVAWAGPGFSKRRIPPAALVHQ